LKKAIFTGETEMDQPQIGDIAGSPKVEGMYWQRKYQVPNISPKIVDMRNIINLSIVQGMEP